MRRAATRRDAEPVGRFYNFRAQTPETVGFLYSRTPHAPLTN
jgi:hypothetical protein